MKLALILSVNRLRSSIKVGDREQYYRWKREAYFCRADRWQYLGIDADWMSRGDSAGVQVQMKSIVEYEVKNIGLLDTPSFF